LAICRVLNGGVSYCPKPRSARRKTSHSTGCRRPARSLQGHAIVRVLRIRRLAVIASVAIGAIGCKRHSGPPNPGNDAHPSPSTAMSAVDPGPRAPDRRPGEPAALEPHRSWCPADAKRTACSTHAGQDLFFHDGAFSSASSGVDKLVQSWISGSLTTAGEPSLSCKQSKEPSYRLSVLHPWGYITIVRLDAHDVTVKSFGRHSATEISHLQIFARRRVFKAEEQTVVNEISNAEFWSMAPTDYFEQVSVRDSVQWVLEVRDANRYHVVTRPGGYRVSRNLPNDKKFARLVSLLLRLGRA
jgi:hypothetical protein